MRWGEGVNLSLSVDTGLPLVSVPRRVRKQHLIALFRGVGGPLYASSDSSLGTSSNMVPPTHEATLDTHIDILTHTLSLTEFQLLSVCDSAQSGPHATVLSDVS